MSFEMSVKSNNLKGQAAKANKALAGAIWIEGNEIMNDSKENYVPVNTGYLRSTGHADEPTIHPTGVEMTLGYDAKYATFVHEAPPGFGQGKHKFLEKPILASARGFASRVAQRAQQILGW